MYRHTIVLWPDEESHTAVIDWKAELLDYDQAVTVADNVVLRGSMLHIQRTISTALILAMLEGPEAAAQRLQECAGRLF